MKGVAFYRIGWVRIGFPNGDVSCKNCPLLGTERIANGYRSYCKRTGEILVSPTETVGRFCPVEMEDEDERIFAEGQQPADGAESSEGAAE